MDKDLKNKTLGELEQLVIDLGQKKYQAKYIFSFIHALNAPDISQITPLAKDFRKQLTDNGFYISKLNTVETFNDPDGTVKYLFELPDRCRIETVLLSDDQRKTLCVSTQVGCVMNCVFCATGKLKFRRNLTAAEIVDQVNTVQSKDSKISNVVFMGMGEPMENYDSVIKAVRILNHPQGKNIGIRHLTVSTCGIIPGILKLAQEDIHPRLAISLNAPTNVLRSKLMPINKKYPLEKLLKAVSTYQNTTELRVTFEYILIDGLNDTVLYAQMLARLLRGHKCNINLIEYNPPRVTSDQRRATVFAASDRTAMKRFAAVLENAGIETTIRLKKGQQINAACGQLGADLLNI
ncbi:MAG: 23S rRNA (adenine(2503)-C(2))-methyltransferase RlmN [Planctomycetota bacterium]|nr:23S rRNA (adenine(2503)-C(2))-methyltransferase RlmN [Planctomycetota bacterium]